MAIETLQDLIECARFHEEMKMFIDYQNELEDIKQSGIKEGRDEILKLFEQGLPVEEIKEWLKV